MHPTRSASSRPSSAAARGGGATAKQRVLSGIQPTGELHLGNYFGALRTWTKYQADYDSYFCVVDLHALSAPGGHDPKVLAHQSRSTVATYLAVGLDPERSTIFVQSHVSAHAELMCCSTATRRWGGWRR